MEINKANDILIFGALEQRTIDAVKKIADEQSLHLVQLDDKVITDYLKGTEKAASDPGMITVEDFLSDEKNKEDAETKALALFNLITHNGDVLTSQDRVFRKADITKKTNLTHKTLGELLQLFSLFGLIEFKKGDYEFSFVFDKNVRQASALADITNTIVMLNQNIVRYLTQFSDNEKKGKFEEIKNEIDKSLIK